MQPMDVVERWFTCCHCHRHTSALNARLPTTACAGCGRSDGFVSAGKANVKVAPTTAAEFLPRGIEHGRKLGAAPRAPSRGAQAANAGALDAAPARRPVGLSTHNDFASEMPSLGADGD